MRRFSNVVTILITSFVTALAGLVASPIASASENDGGISATFASGSSVLSDDQKAAIKKALASSGSDATFIVTGTAGKLPGVSDSKVKRLAKARAKAIKAYLVSLGVSKTRVTTQVKMTEIGVTPKSIGSNPKPAPTPTVTAVATNNAPALTCATGATCVVGDRGPGGGIVYYVDNAGFSCWANYTTTGSPTDGLCKYLEVAPNGWNSSLYDPAKVWAIPTYQSVDVTDIANDTSAYNNALGIGLGYKNSVAILTQGNDATTAAGTAHAYAFGNKNDWYLPTTAELNLLCQWNRQVSPAVGTACALGTLNSPTYGADSAGFEATYYWSSSEPFASGAWSQSFVDGAQFGGGSKASNPLVRPVRAF